MQQYAGNTIRESVMTDHSRQALVGALVTIEPTMRPIAHNAMTLPVTSADVRIGSAFAIALNPVDRSRSMLSTA